MEILCISLFALACITVVGHGLWLFFARLLAGVEGEKPRRPPPTVCVGCDKTLSPWSSVCQRCGLHQDSSVAGDLRELAAVARSVRRLAARQELDVEGSERLLAALTRQRDTLLTKKPVPASPIRPAEPVTDRNVPPVSVPPPPLAVLTEEQVEEVPAQEVPPPPVVRVVEEVVSPPGPVLPPPSSPPPRRSWTDVFAGFMEERNILWGELVGGLLIVGCSTALVITLWQTLEQIPYFPFLVLSGISLALFGAGHYTLHHWKLESTSRGLLVIATLLVPLNLLVLAGLSRGREGGAIETATTAAGLAAFVAMVAGAGRVLAARSRWLLTLGVVGAASAQLLVPRLPDLPWPWLVVLPVWMTVACHCVAVGARLRQVREDQPLLPAEVHSLLLFLGVVVFAVAVALGFLLSRAADMRQALQFLALPLAVAGVPILAAGLLLQRRLGEAPPSEEDSQSLGGLRATGTAIALAGILVLLGAVPLAWPHPTMLFAVCAVNVVVMTVLAFRYRMPLAHLAALFCLVFGYLTAFHLGAASVTVAEVFSADHGAALAVLVVLLAGAAEVLVRRGLLNHAVEYAFGAAVVALLSLVLVTQEGAAQPARAALVFGLYGLTALLANVRWQRPPLSYAGHALILSATLWGLSAGWPSQRAIWGLVLALEALALAALAAWAGHWGKLDGVGETTPEPRIHPWHRVLTAPCHNVAILATGLSVLFALVELDAPGATHSLTAFALATAIGLLVWVNGWSFGTWFGAFFLWAGLTRILVTDLPEGAVPRPWLTALLVHSSLLMLPRVILGRFAPAERLPLARAAKRADHRVNILFTVPLGRIALAVSLLALSVMLMRHWGESLALAANLAWVAFLWLAFARVGRSPGWLTAGQAALSAAVLMAAAAWVEVQAWGSVPVNLGDLRTLHALGIGQGLLGLVWVALRLGLRRYEPAHVLLSPPWPAWDRVVLGALVFGQLALAVWGVWPGVVRELTPEGAAVNLGEWSAGAADAFGIGAWLLLGLLAVVLACSLWDRATPAIFGLMVLALTVPVLASGQSDGALATATALRWWLGLALLACSLPLWLRSPLKRGAARAGIDTTTGVPVSLVLREPVILFTAGPILALTVVVAALGFAGLAPSGPVAESLFGRLAGVAGNVTPLVLVCLGLVGHALRERSPGYAFAAGLVADTALMGGYALAVVTGDGRMDTEQWVRVLQLGTLGAALWGLAWLLSRRWAVAWREAPAQESGSPIRPTKAARPLMLAQLGMGITGNVCLLLAALVPMVWAGPGHDAGPGVAATGSLLGWFALMAALAAPAVRLVQRGTPLPWHGIGLAALAVVGLLACTLERHLPGYGYRALLGVAGLAFLWSLGKLVEGRPVPSPLLAGYPGGDRAAVWVKNLGLLAVFLGLKAAVDGDWLWAAATIGLVSVAGVCMAFWLRRERWAFVAGWGVNLSASLIVCHLQVGTGVRGLWISLALVNILASAGVAFLWLLADRHFSVWTAWQREKIPLLGAQSLLGLAGLALLLLIPLVVLVADPGHALPSPLVAIGQPLGWLAWLLGLAAALWFGNRRAPWLVVSLLGIGGLCLGVLAACSVDRWQGPWFAYHVLTICWGLIGAGTIALTLPESLRWPAFALRRWAEGIGLALVVLGLRAGWSDPLRPYPSSGPVLLAALMAGTLALHFGRPAYVGLSGMLLTLAGTLAWVAWGPATLSSLTLTVVLSLATAGLVWTLVDLLLSERISSWQGPRRPRPFQHPGTGLALVLLASVVVWGVDATLAEGDFRAVGVLAWSALLVTTAALVVSLWDRKSSLGPAGLFAVGLLATAMVLQELSLAPDRFCRLGSLALAAYLLLTAAVAGALPRLSGLLHALRLPPHLHEQSPRGWFRSTHAALACLVLGLSLWVSLSFATPLGRLAGPVVVLLLLPTCLLLMHRASDRGLWMLRHAALALGALFCIEAGWTLLTPAAAGWLHHSAAAVAVLSFLAVAYADGLKGLLPASAWRPCARDVAAVLSGLAVLMLLVLLGQEFMLYDKVNKQTPLTALEAGLVVLAVLALVYLAIRAAVVGPVEKPVGGRTLYVYGSEVLLVLLFVHLKLSLPQLFGTWGAKYWTLLVMALAYVGVGLAEYFRRRDLPVLAGPLQRAGLFLPLLPILVFWLRPPASLIAAAEQVTPGAGPLLRYLQTMSTALDKYALLWFLLSVLYLLVALSRRSLRFALLAALAANVGLWVLLAHFDVGFLLHPQMWLIPLALIVLASEHYNRNRLTREQSLTLRYIGLSMVYISSTADLFLAGLGRSVTLPVVLAVLSVLGVLFGILLRVRAFLFMGLMFLGLDVFTMIWHAAVDRTQTWVWYVSGIVLGSAILALFALFEKRRNDVLALLEEIKRWD